MVYRATLKLEESADFDLGDQDPDAIKVFLESFLTSPWQSLPTAHVEQKTFEFKVVRLSDSPGTSESGPISPQS